MLTYFRARTKDFGACFIKFNVSYKSLTNSATDTFTLGGINDKDDTGAIPGHTAYVDEILISSVILPVSAGQTVTGALKKYDASAGAAVTLASSINMITSFTAGKCERIAFDTGVTDSQRILDFGDTLYFESVQSGTVSTQPSTNVSVLVKILT